MTDTPTTRCGAKKRDGTPCEARPLKGKKRCRLHGGGAGAPVDTGRRSTEWRHLSTEGRELVAELMKDPQLLDVRRMLALMEAIARRHLFPSPELIERTARARWAEAKKDGLTEADGPDAVDVEEAERELFMRAWGTLDKLSARMDAASKTAKVDEIMIGLLLPSFEELGQILARVLEKHVPNEVARREAREDVTRALRVVLARAHATASELRR